jgi:hypothetical protein
MTWQGTSGVGGRATVKTGQYVSILVTGLGGGGSVHICWSVIGDLCQEVSPCSLR